MNKIVELIEGGFLAQTIIVISVCVIIVVLALQGAPIPDWIKDSGLFILGFYFRSAVSQQATKIS